MHVALPINTSTRAKRVAQKIKADSRVLLRTTPVLTVHDTRLVGVPSPSCINGQTALQKPFGDPFHDVFRLATTAAMQQAIVGVTTERNMWHLASDPGIECVVQKQVGQHRTHDPLGSALMTFCQRAIGLLHRNLQPTLDVQQHPTTLAMETQGLHQKLVADVVEETSDVELDNPIVSPATLARYGNGIVSGTPGTITVRIFIENGFPQFNVKARIKLTPPLCSRATWPVNRFPPDSSQGNINSPVLTPFKTFDN